MTKTFADIGEQSSLHYCRTRSRQHELHSAGRVSCKDCETSVTAAGACLIFDEVMTGFRVAPGGAQQYYGVTPDITTLGKVVGGGLPVGAFGGRRDIMEYIAPTGPVYQAGTLSGNPVAMAAGLETLKQISKKGFHEQLAKHTEQLAKGIKKAADTAGIPLTTNYIGGMFGLFFTEDEQVQHYAQVTNCDVDRFKAFYHCMLNEGIYLAPSAFEAGFVSSAHSEADIKATIDAASTVFGIMAS